MWTDQSVSDMVREYRGHSVSAYYSAMRAAVLRNIDGPLSIEEVELDAPGPHEVLITTTAAGVCHSDLHFIEGLYATELPFVPGHESAGVVKAVGNQVTYVQAGDHVITCMSAFCGECGVCTTGRPYLCESPSTVRDGGDRLRLDGAPVNQLYGLASYAEELLVHERAVVKIRKDMPLDRAALIGCAVMTGYGAVVNTAKVEPGSSVVVIGCGGIGLSAINGAAIIGAGRIIAVDMLAEKLELARTFGATDVIDASVVDPVAAVLEMTGGGVPYTFEAVGLKRTAEQAFEMLCAGGDATVIGMVPEGQKVEIDGSELLFEKTLRGSNMGSNRFRVDMPRLVDFYLDGRLHLDELISKRVGLEEINDAFVEMKTGVVARSVILFE
jgi:S-(hydroxymethyl)glutathione dehydrogenase/alcohol dehydrogenase